MKDIFAYLRSVSINSDFKAELSERGGYITFSNSGRRGGVKYFQIGLDSILQTLKDIHSHIDVFSRLMEYEETPWRNNGSALFTDAVANANSTVQTKPLFSTLSKIIVWANQPALDAINPDRHIELSEPYLTTAIEQLEQLAHCFRFKPQISLNNIEKGEKFAKYRPYITAIKSKPFLLLAGISGTGKSRIVRELARACWAEDTEEYRAQKPKNFQMVQVKPNWHDSSDLMGYVSRVSGKAEYVAGDFLKFIARAWEDTDTPYFLCLDEMNLAPVEQYFAEYLSVIESRKLGEDGVVTTDPILEKADEEWYFNLTASLTADEAVRQQFNEEGIAIPQNLIVVGTVNMDETTFSFSRKVLDRAMTIEMNEVDLRGGLTERNERIGLLSKAELVGTAVEGVDVYADHQEVCDQVLTYLEAVNAVLEGTPFKVAYRTRNEFLLYVVNNLPYDKDEEDNERSEAYVVARALDEITSMKVLSRIEGDDTKVSDAFLDRLSATIKEGLQRVAGEEQMEKSISCAKLQEMKNKLASGYTSFWS